MSPFIENIRKIITQYKQILKRHLPAKAFASKIKLLQIKRTQLKYATDVDLFNTVDRILYEIESMHANKNVASSEYSGLDEFRDHIKNIIVNYEIKDNKVINRCQHASRTLVESVQLLKRPMDGKTIEQLKSNIIHLKRHGHEEEFQKLNRALKKLKITEITEHHETS